MMTPLARIGNSGKEAAGDNLPISTGRVQGCIGEQPHVCQGGSDHSPAHRVL